MRPKPAWAILALLLGVGGVWATHGTLVQGQDAELTDRRGETRLSSSLELGSPHDLTAQYDFEQQLTFDERASLIKLKSRFAIADPDCPLPTSDRQPFYLKLREPLSREFAQRLQDAGASFVGYAYPHTHFIRAKDSDSLAQIREIIENSTRVAGTLLRMPMDACNEDAWGYLNDPDFELGLFRITFWRDTPPERMAQVLKDHNLAMVESGVDPDRRSLPDSPYWNVILDRPTLEALARHDDIDWIQPKYQLVHHNSASTALANAGPGDIGPGTSYNLTGDGLVSCIFDGGTALDTHNDFQNGSSGNPFSTYFSGIGSKRVLIAPTISSQQSGWGITDTSPVDYHPTHVTGTVVGDGATSSSARGYAPEGYAISMGWGNMEAERRILRHYFRIVADNHSYGYQTGAPTGGYDSSCQVSDQDIRDIWVNMTKSAGNDGSGSDTCTDDSCMKNSFTIAAVSDTGGIASFSSRGPTDDGRLIPHFSANGTGLTSTSNAGNSAHGSSSGTSMSSPSANGSLVLLTEMWQREMNDREFAPDTARAILAATCDDKYNQGPDYRFGFGVIDVKRAADLILANSSTGGDHVIRGTIRQGESYDYDVQVTSSGNPLKVVCSWMDIYGSNGASVTLVNNIDVQLIAPNGSTVHYPWRGLTSNGNQTYQWTRNSANNRDNIELCEVDTPATGTWTIRVTGTSIPANPQNGVPNDATGFVLVSENRMSTAQQTFEDSLNSGSPLSIPDNSSTGLVRTFSVTNTNAVRNVRVYVDVRHERRGDIEIVVEHPDGTTADIETTDGSTRQDVIGVFPDTRQYDDDTEVFNTKPANGTWTVYVRDRSSGNTGTLEYLALEIDYDTVNPPANQPPTANAGSDQVVDEGATVNLSGSGTDPESDPLTYSWSQVSGPTVTLANPSTQTPSFVAPQVATQQIVVLRLTVDDGNFNTDTDDVSITINDVPAPNQPPVANAGVDFSVTEGVGAQLHGNNSSDPDGDPLTYSWTQISGPSITLSGPTTAQPTFAAAPQVSTATNATFELTVDDGNGGSDTDTVTITILDSVMNNPPTAAAGADFYAAHGAVTALDGSQSVDPDGDPLTFSWVQISGGNSVTLSGANTATPSFNAPAVDDTLTFELTVDDGNGNASNDYVIVSVNATGLPGGGGGGSSSSGGGGGGDDDGGCSTGSSNTWLLALLLALVGTRVVLNHREA